MSEDVQESSVIATADTETEKEPQSSSDKGLLTAPAYYLSMSISNFRCFKQRQTLNLSSSEGEPARWTLILGENGVGKTSLLQLLALMQLHESNPVHWPSGAISKILSPNIAYFSSMLKDIPDAISILGDSEKVTENRDKCKVSCSISSGRVFDSFTQSNVFNYDLNSGEYGLGGGTILLGDKSALICYGYGANRRMGATSLSLSPDMNTSASLFSDTIELLNAEEWLLQADYTFRRSKGDKSKSAEMRFNRVKSILTEILPDVEDLRITESSSITASPHVQAKTPYGWVPIQNLSLGYRTLLTWMVDLAARLFERYPDSKNPLAEPAIVLVDEIDLHLHPRWQRMLIQFLSDTFPNTQFIATAHSPLVVQAAADANIVLLRREGDHVIIENDVETIKNWRIDQVLTSDLYGLPSARPPQLDAALKEREHILSKSRLTKVDKERLTQLEQLIGELPTGETPTDIEAMDIIRQAAELLK